MQLELLSNFPSHFFSSLEDLSGAIFADKEKGERQVIDEYEESMSREPACTGKTVFKTGHLSQEQRRG